jgi:hypothetical protein
MKGRPAAAFLQMQMLDLLKNAFFCGRCFSMLLMGVTSRLDANSFAVFID